MKLVTDTSMLFDKFRFEKDSEGQSYVKLEFYPADIDSVRLQISEWLRQINQMMNALDPEDAF